MRGVAREKVAEGWPAWRDEALRPPLSDPFAFIPQGGETGALLRGIDWAHHPLGPVEAWPAALKATLAIIHATRHPMVLWWGLGLYQFYNDAFIPCMGADKHPVSFAQRCAESWPEAWHLIAPLIRDSWEDGRATWHEDRLVPIQRDGTLEEAYWTFGFSPVNDAEGAIVGVLNVVTETTEKVLALRELRHATDGLRRAQEQLRSFMIQAPVGLAILEGPQHVYTLLNPVFRAMCFGSRPESDFLGKAVRTALPELAGQGYYEILGSVYRTGVPFRGAKLRASMRQANGEKREMFVNFICQARRDEGGRIDGIVAVVFEVTDQVNEQREIETLADNLREAIVSRDAFLGVASHELNTPLTSLALRSDLMARQLARCGHNAVPKECVAKFVGEVQLHSKRLERLVGDMLDVSRLSTGEFPIAPADADLSELVHKILDGFLPRCQAAGCCLERSIVSHLRAHVDGARMEQVLSNLLTNALKYAPKGRVHVTLTAREHCYWLAVRDEGPGIASHDQERIFARFERAHSASEVSGLGLGLFISNQIVEAHGGLLSVQSVLGQGTTFLVKLPGMDNAQKAVVPGSMPL